jgi:hypothetical protein
MLAIGKYAQVHQLPQKHARPEGGRRSRSSQKAGSWPLYDSDRYLGIARLNEGISGSAIKVHRDYPAFHLVYPFANLSIFSGNFLANCDDGNGDRLDELDVFHAGG